MQKESASLNLVRTISDLTETVPKLCEFYTLIKEYEELTANETSIKSSTIKAVLREVYSDSCKWISVLVSQCPCSNSHH